MWNENNFYYKVYYGSTLLRDSSDNDEFFETYVEATEEAQDFIEARIEQWKLDGAWHEEDSEEEFNVVIEEVNHE